MEIIAIIGLVVMGVILGRVSKNTETPYYVPLGSRESVSMKCSGLEYKIFRLEQENSVLDFLYKSMEMKKRCFQEEYAAHCNFCSKTFYSREFKDKEVAKMLNDITLNSEEIAKKLGFDKKA